jgi:hypothetical protein
MIKAQELRIGNLLVLGPNVVTVQQIGQNSFAYEKGENLFADICPIDLTEDWLLKFGFEGPKKEAGTYYQKDNHRVYLFDSFFEFEFTANKDSRFNLFRSYQYVHQLQNLYFALTGTELTLKEI